MSYTRYKHGQWNAICDVCGFEYKSGSLRKRWDGLMVCKQDWEERHPMDSFRAPREDQSIPWSRPEGTDSGGTDISGNTFPPTRTDTTDDIPPSTFNITSPITD